MGQHRIMGQGFSIGAKDPPKPAAPIVRCCLRKTRKSAVLCIADFSSDEPGLFAFIVKTTTCLSSWINWNLAASLPMPSPSGRVAERKRGRERLLSFRRNIRNDLRFTALFRPSVRTGAPSPKGKAFPRQISFSVLTRTTIKSEILRVAAVTRRIFGIISSRSCAESA